METTYTTIKDRFEKFRGKPFRAHQEDIISFAHQSKKKFVIIEAPTGIGKTLCGMTVGKLVHRAIYTVHSKPLQTQIENDFPGTPILWGRNNYPCALNPEVTADVCGGGAKCDAREDCEYMHAKIRALASSLCVLNYHYLLTELNFVGSFSGRDIIVIDEADSLESVLASFIGINLSERMIKEYKLRPPQYKTTTSDKSIPAWRNWAEDTIGTLGLHRKQLSMIVGDGDIITQQQVDALKKQRNVENNISKLLQFKKHVDEEWLYEEKRGRFGNSMHFNPTWITEELAEKYLWRHADKFVFMSATFPYLPILAKLLGIPQDKIDYRQYPSVFPEEHRQVKYKIAGNLVYKDMKEEIPKVVAKIKEIINDPKHVHEKGLIHTVSYKLCEAVLSINDKRLVSHIGDINKADLIQHFIQSKEPLILVSPSMERGISLDDDLCRFIIWVKAPFLSMADKMVAARLYGSGIGNIWYKSMMLLSIVQGCGRGVRSETDHSVTYLLDEQIKKAIMDNPNMVPKWFREAIW